MHPEFYTAALDLLFSKRPASPSSTPAVRDRAILFHGNFFLEEELYNAMNRCSVEPILFAYNNNRSMAVYEDELQRLIQCNRPSFLLSVNMKGFDANGALEDMTARMGVPVVVWFVDDPRPILMHRLSFVKNNMLAACWEKTYLPYLRESGFSKAVYLPLATDPQLFSPNAEAPRTKLGFVGSAMVDYYSGNIIEKFLWSDRLSALADQVSDRILADPFIPVEKEIHACSKALNLSLPFSDTRNLTWLQTLCIHRASMKKRKSIVGGLFNEGIETFGDPRGWKSLLGDSVRTHPNIDYRSGLARTYRDICLNINITSCQMPSAINQRTFDIPCCGGFVASDNQKDLHELFDVDREAVAYEHILDLKDKLRYFWSHEAKRRQIIKAARARIISEHTYVHRIGSIAGLLK
jgi:spore maturation protein CgeB